MSRRIGKRGDHMLGVRMPGDLRERIRKAAERSGQSMNTAVVIALEEAFPAPLVEESINGALLQAAENVVRQWSDLLGSIGQEPESNKTLMDLKEQLHRASLAGAEAKGGEA